MIIPGMKHCLVPLVFWSAVEIIHKIHVHWPRTSIKTNVSTHTFVPRQLNGQKSIFQTRTKHPSVRRRDGYQARCLEGKSSKRHENDAPSYNDRVNTLFKYMWLIPHSTRTTTPCTIIPHCIRPRTSFYIRIKICASPSRFIFFIESRCQVHASRRKNSRRKHVIYL